jgi:excinuclease ABC subunit C
MEKVRAAQRFLAGTDNTLLEEMHQAMTLAAQAQQFERAAALRDKLDVLTWLTSRLEALRQARARMSFVYPVAGKDEATLWYLIHASRTVKAVAAPRDPAGSKLALAAIRSVFGGPSPDLLESHEHVDGMMLVRAWFRKYPKELKKTLTPDEALAKCR